MYPVATERNNYAPCRLLPLQPAIPGTRLPMASRKLRHMMNLHGTATSYLMAHPCCT